MMQRMGQRLPAFGVVDEIILNKWITLDGPHIPQHLEEHACRAAGDALTP